MNLLSKAIQILIGGLIGLVVGIAILGFLSLLTGCDTSEMDAANARYRQEVQAQASEYADRVEGRLISCNRWHDCDVLVNGQIIQIDCSPTGCLRVFSDND